MLLGPPYAAAYALIGWAANNWAELDGAALLDSGLDLTALSLPRFLSVVQVAIRRSIINGAADEKERDAELRRFDDLLAGHSTEPEPETWGTAPSAVAEQNAMMAMVGG